MERRLTHAVTPEQDGRRVDAVLRESLHLTGSVIRRIKWLPDGILLDGEKTFPNVLVKPGQVLDVAVDDPSRENIILAAPGPLDIVYEDGDVIVLNKAAGVSVHPGPGHFDDTLGNFLLHHYDREGETADFHPVHRLDRGTSGLMVAAKHPHAQEVLKKQLHTESFRRVYLAVCEGIPEPPSGTLDAPLGPKPGSLVEQTVRPDGKPARTRYEVLERWGGRALLSLELETGRTHQIRVHLAHIGHPLTGDFLYGAEDRALIGRPALHSGLLSFLHPITGERLQFTLPLPEDMARLKQ